MTNLQINQLIAEYCKWKPTTDGGICWDANGNAIIAPPNYANDLNEMRKAEITLWCDECLVEKYQDNIQEEYLHNVGYQGAAYWFMANAHTKAVAFLKTIGKWEN